MHQLHFVNIYFEQLPGIECCCAVFDREKSRAVTTNKYVFSSSLYTAGCVVNRLGSYRALHIACKIVGEMIKAIKMNYLVLLSVVKANV